ncbi:MAG: hypothetical protein ACE364_02310 [Chlorobiota bacterium]
MAKEVNISDLSDNDILSKTITNKYNQVLLKKGTVIQVDSHIKILKTWGIEKVSIETDLSESNENNNIEIDEDLIEAVKERLQWGNLNKNEQILFDLIVASKSNQV